MGVVRINFEDKIYELQPKQDDLRTCSKCAFNKVHRGCREYNNVCGEGYFTELRTENKPQNITVGVKDDSNKRQWWYMDNFWPDLGEVVDVLTYGDKKYPADDGANWKRLEKPEQRFSDAMLRHILAYRSGEKIDPETGKSHLAHAITNALMLMFFDRSKDEEKTK